MYNVLLWFILHLICHCVVKFKMKRYNINNYYKKIESVSDVHETVRININNKNEHELVTVTANSVNSELSTSLVDSSHDSTHSLMINSCSTFDIKNIVGINGLTDAEKIDHFTNIWTPGK